MPTNFRKRWEPILAAGNILFGSDETYRICDLEKKKRSDIDNENFEKINNISEKIEEDILTSDIPSDNGKITPLNAIKWAMSNNIPVCQECADWYKQKTSKGPRDNSKYKTIVAMALALDYKPGSSRQPDGLWGGIISKIESYIETNSQIDTSKNPTYIDVDSLKSVVEDAFNKVNFLYEIKTKIKTKRTPSNK